MPNASIGRSSQVTMDGRLRAIPGFEEGDYDLDAAPFLVHSSVLTTHTAEADQDPQMVPFDGTIVGVFANVIEASGTAPGTVIVGTLADPDHFVNDYSVATDATLGFVDITDDATVLNASVDQGDIITFGSNGEATTTGQVILTLLIVPRVG